jgi:CHAT domain-containing protein
MRRSRMWRGIIAMALAWVFSVHAGEAEWKEKFDAGMAEFKRNRYVDAAREFESARREAGSFVSAYPEMASTLGWLARTYDELRQDAQAEPLYIRSLDIYEDALGPEQVEVNNAYDNLAEFYKSRHRYADAEKLIRRLLAIREKVLGPKHPRVADLLTYVGHLLLLQHRLEEAKQLNLRALKIYQETPGPADPQVASVSGNVATILVFQHRFAEAEPLAKRSLEILEKIYGPDHAYVANALSSVATISFARGNLFEAEQHYRRVLAIRERSGTLNDLESAETLGNLAQIYESQGRYEDARGLYARAISMWEKVLGADNANMTGALSGLGRILEIQGKLGEAEKLYRRSLEITEKTAGPTNPANAGPLNDLGVILFAQKHYAEAESLYQRSLSMEIAAKGAEHPVMATALTNLAELYQAQGRFTEAESLYRRALAILEGTFGPEHPALAPRMTYLAGLFRSQSRLNEALVNARRASAILTANFTQRKREPQHAIRTKLATGSWQFEQHIAILADVAQVSSGKASQAAYESFEIAQRARISDTAEQVAIMAARHAAGTDALAKLARARQDALQRLEQMERDFVGAVSGAPDERNKAKEAELHTAEQETRSQIALLDKKLDREFPRYWELTSRKPLALRAAQQFLGPAEALLVFLVADGDSYAWAVRKNEVRFVRLSISRGDLATLVRKLRTQLDLGAGEPAAMLKRPFDVVTANELYRKLFGAVESQLSGVKHLILVPDRALQSLPPGVLVTELPTKPMESIEELASIAWLAKKYAITVLPAVSSLRALRQFAGKPTASQPFSGFGDPVLAGNRGAARGANLSALYSRGAVADTNEVRKLEPLPESADELRAIAAALKAPISALRLGPAATERAVKDADLTRYRNLAFATHGLMAGEFNGLAEPALVLTPPETGSMIDDGLLTASEISQLKLDADWVVLSACNTAAPDGTPGADGLSGLARAFFYAGARSLLVSHWSVSSDATVALTTRMFEESSKGVSKAEALRRSMLALMARTDKPYFAHPAFWVPFVVVGEGNAEWAGKR